MIEPIGTSEPELLTTSSVLNGVRLSSRIMPAVLAARGGDWCEAFAVSDDLIAFSIGDVCGHGVHKSAAMVAVREAIRDAVGCGLNPAQALAEANRFLRRYDSQESATAILAFLSTRRRSLVFANAGHPPPIITSLLGTLFLDFSAADLPLGIKNDGLAALHCVNVPASTLLVFYTDGVIERERKPLLGLSQLHDAAVFAYEVPSLPSAAVIERHMVLSGSNIDDAAILTARTPLSPIVRNVHPRLTLVRRAPLGER